MKSNKFDLTIVVFFALLISTFFLLKDDVLLNYILGLFAKTNVSTSDTEFASQFAIQQSSFLAKKIIHIIVYLTGFIYIVTGFFILSKYRQVSRAFQLMLMGSILLFFPSIFGKQSSGVYGNEVYDRTTIGTIKPGQEVSK